MIVENLIPSMITAAFGAIFLCAGIYRWKERYFCKEVISGKFQKIVVYTQYATRTTAVFEYYYAGKKRRHEALDDLSSKQRKQFKEGEIYTLYVNPKNPDVCRCTKKVFKWEDLLLILAGGVIVGGAIVQLF